MTDCKSCTNKFCSQTNPQPISNFYKDSDKKDGLATQCISCKKISNKEWRENNVEYRRSVMKKYQKENSEKLKKYYKDYREAHKERRTKQIQEWKNDNPNYSSEYYYKHKKELNKQNREWQIKNASKIAAKEAKRRSEKLKATPKWLSETQLTGIQKFYDECPKGFEVDHIIPLKGKNVRGLHVPWNLQILPEKENRKKGNKLVL